MAIEGRLEIIHGAETGQTIALGATLVTFGRALGNVVVVKDAVVSRQHAKIFERDGRHFVADLNSSHGTFVNGAKVTLQELHPGDEVKLGTTTFRYGVIESPAARAGVIPPHVVAPAKPLPPINTTYRSGLTETGEDPFALEEPEPTSAPPPKPAPTNATAPIAPQARMLPIAPQAPMPDLKTPAPPADLAPQIEFRGRTAEQFAARGTAAAAPAAPGRGAGVHVPPPLSNTGGGPRGPLSFLKDELDQRGRFARAVATLFALAVAGGLLWVTLWLVDSGTKGSPRPDENAPTGPDRPTLPTRH